MSSLCLTWSLEFEPCEERVRLAIMMMTVTCSALKVMYGYSVCLFCFSLPAKWEPRAAKTKKCPANGTLSRVFVYVSSSLLLYIRQVLIHI